MKYVIGVEGGLTASVLRAKGLDGVAIAEKVGPSTNHSIVGISRAARRVHELVEALLQQFGGRKADCRCMVVGATGIDSPQDKLFVETFYAGLGFRCPVFCMNDGSVALYEATRGIGLVAIAGVGSIVVGRNAEGKLTRSGGYPLTIMGDEGSERWISTRALKHMSHWVDGSVPDTPLVDNIVAYFHGFDSNKLIQCANSLRRRQINTELAGLVYRAADAGDAAALWILRDGAAELYAVAKTVIRKLGFRPEDAFLAGLWGQAFRKADRYAEEYRRLISAEYPKAEIVLPEGDGADGAARLALDYLAGGVGFIAKL